MALKNLAIIGLGLVALSSCSDPTQAQSQSPEEVAAFMVWGVKAETTAQLKSSRGVLTFKTTKTADTPLTHHIHLRADGNGSLTELNLMDLTTRRNSDCVYTFELKPLDRGDRNYPPIEVKIDFTNLKAAVHQPHTNNVLFEGAIVECLGPDAKMCARSKSQFKDGKWPLRLGPFDKQELSRKLLGGEVKKLDEAVAYFRANVCKPS